MKDKRPVNLDIGTIHLPLTAYVSILHRISGVILFAGIALGLWLLDVSLSSEEGFNTVRNAADSLFFKLVLWGVLSAFIYHLAAGVRHLLMDLGIGESLEGGLRSSRITLAVSIVLIIAAGVWLW